MHTEGLYCLCHHLAKTNEKKNLRDVYSKMWICIVVASVVNEQHMVDKDVGIIQINAHVAFKDLHLLWKHNTDGPWDGSTPPPRFVQSQEQGCRCAVETVLHKPDKLSEWPTFGLGLDLTNWITAQSSFYSAMQTADRKVRPMQDLQPPPICYNLIQFDWRDSTPKTCPFILFPVVYIQLALLRNSKE